MNKGKISTTIKKVLFPFYNKERHQFLMANWVFRVIVVIYIIALITLFFYLINYFSNFYWGWCYHDMYSLIYKPDNMTASIYFDEQTIYCDAIRKSNVLTMWLCVISTTLIPYYLIQLFFFKIIVNFIILGGKK